MTILNADKWLYSKMTTDTQLATALGGRVYSEIAPQHTQYPCVVFQQVSSLAIANVSVDPIMDDELWQVRIVVDKPDYTAIETIADRIKAVLHKASGTGVIGCVYEGLQRLSETESGKFYQSIILEFRLFTQ